MWEQEFTTELKAARNGEKQQVLDKYATLTGKSVQHLYRIAKKHGYVSGRKKRRDAGTCILTDQQISLICGLIHTSGREVKGPIMDVETALQIAEDSGYIDKGAVSVSRLRAILREREMNRAAMNAAEPHIRMRSLHPNHVHVFDMSVCIQYYLKGKKGLRIMRQDMFYKNKWKNFVKVKDKLIRYVIADHFSHTIFLKYYYTGGETQENLFDFLSCAWGGGKHEKFPFRGVPFAMLYDKGAANTSLAMVEFFKRLDIQTPDSLPHNPRRQGSAEVTQNIVETKFESRLRFQPAHTVEDLNAWALDWCVHFNATKRHTRHGMPRTQCWLQIQKDQLRELPEPEILQYLFAKPGEPRRVKGDYTITYCYKSRDTHTYSLKHIPEIIPNKSTVDVILRPYSWPEIGVVFKGEEYLATPMGHVAGGFREDAAVIGREYKAMPETLTQKAKKKAENLAYGEERKKDAVPFEGVRVFGHHADKVDVEFLPRQGTPIHMGTGTVEDVMISMMRFFAELTQEGITITKHMNRAVREAYGDSISRAEADRIITAVTAGTDLVTAINERSGDAALKTAAS